MNFFTNVCQCIMETKIFAQYLQNLLGFPFQVCFGIQVLPPLLWNLTLLINLKIAFSSTT